jgi:flagellar protein FliO/FliZ
MRRLVFCLCLILLLAIPAFASAATNRITGATVEEDESELRVSFQLTHPETFEGKDLKVESKGSLYWIEIPNSTDKQKKRIFYSWENKRLRGLGLRRLKGKKVAVRVLFKGKAKPEDPTWASAVIENGELVVTFPNQAPAPVVVEKDAKPEDSQENAVASPPIDLNAIFDKAPAAGAQPSNETQTAVATGSDAAREEPGSETASTTAGSIPSLASAAAKFASALLIVVGIIFVSAWVAKRFNLRDRLSGSEPGVVRVVGTAMLGLKKQVAVIDVAGQFWVVGLGPSEITLLGKVDDPDAIASLTKQKTRMQTRTIDDSEPEPAIEKQQSRGKDFDAPIMPDIPEPAKDSVEDPSPFSKMLDFKQQDDRKEAPPVEDLETIRSIKQRLQKLKRL